jgi:hypothetical protein
MALKNIEKYLIQKNKFYGTSCPFYHAPVECTCVCTYDDSWDDYDEDRCSGSCCNAEPEEVSPQARFIAECILTKISTIASMNDEIKKQVLNEILLAYRAQPDIYKEDIKYICTFFKDTEIENKLFALIFGAAD